MPQNIKLQGYYKLQGVIGSPFYAPEVTTWLSNIQKAGFARPSPISIYATNQLLAGLSATGLRSKIKRLNLFNGGDWLGSFYPVIADVGSTWDWNGSVGSTTASLSTGIFNSTDWTFQNGFDGSRVNTVITADNVAGGAFLDTGVIMNSTDYQNGSIHMSVYVSTTGTKTVGNVTDIGLKSSSTYPSSTTALRTNYNLTGGRGQAGFVTYNGQWISPTANALCYMASVTPPDPRGFTIGTRASLNSTTYYRNNVKPDAYYNPTTNQYFYNPNTTAVTQPASNTFSSTFPVTIFAFGGNYAQGTANKINSNYSDRAMTMYSIGTGLTDPDATNYTTLIQRFNTTVGRTNYA
jgi:hypothetical protein